MRMWGVDPKLMCQQHLLGEHVEIHMFFGCIQKGISIQGYIDKGLVEVHNLVFRHNSLAKEIQNRGWCHHSPIETIPWAGKIGKINLDKNRKELSRRCSKCREAIEYEERMEIKRLQFR